MPRVFPPLQYLCFLLKTLLDTGAYESALVIIPTFCQTLTTVLWTEIWETLSIFHLPPLIFSFVYLFFLLRFPPWKA